MVVMAVVVVVVVVVVLGLDHVKDLLRSLPSTIHSLEINMSHQTLVLPIAFMDVSPRTTFPRESSVSPCVLNLRDICIVMLMAKIKQMNGIPSMLMTGIG
jgi:hypothetical protein